MTNIVRILKECDDRIRCMLFDELGAGTDPTEGAALAISHHRVRAAQVRRAHRGDDALRGAQGLRYHGEARRHERLVRVRRGDSLRPTYRLLVGIPGQVERLCHFRAAGRAAGDHQRTRSSRVGTESASLEATIEKLEAGAPGSWSATGTRRQSKLREAEDEPQGSPRSLQVELSVRLEKADAEGQAATRSASSREARRDGGRGCIRGDRRAARDGERRTRTTARANDARAALRRKLNEAEDAAVAAAHRPCRRRSAVPRAARRVVGDTVQLLSRWVTSRRRSRPSIQPTGTLSLQRGHHERDGQGAGRVSASTTRSPRRKKKVSRRAEREPVRAVRPSPRSSTCAAWRRWRPSPATGALSRHRRHGQARERHHHPRQGYRRAARRPCSRRCAKTGRSSPTVSAATARARAGVTVVELK